MRAYSMDLRERVVRLPGRVDDPGRGAEVLGERVLGATAQAKAQGHRLARPAPAQPGSPGRPVTLAPHDVRALVRGDPDATLAELRQR